DISQGVGRMIQTEVDAVMPVQQKQLPPVPIVPIVYVNPRPAIVRETEQQPLLDLLEVAGLDVVLSLLFLIPVSEKLVLDAKFRSQVRVDKGNVVMDLTDLKDLLPSEA